MMCEQVTPVDYSVTPVYSFAWRSVSHGFVGEKVAVKKNLLIKLLVLHPSSPERKTITSFTSDPCAKKLSRASTGQ